MTVTAVCCARVWAEKRKQEDFEETEADAVRQTAVEAEDAWEDELKAFTPAPRRTGMCTLYSMPLTRHK